MPEFKLTFDEMKNFKKYLNEYQELGARYGAIKIIPPTEWSAYTVNEHDEVDLEAPLEQEFDLLGKFAIISNNDQINQVMKLNYRDGTEVSEEEYWSAGLKKVLYGADQNKTLFGQDCKVMNLSEFDDQLKKLNIAGISSSFVYYGKAETTFSWHVEDCAFYSINYLHKGKAKRWYSIGSNLWSIEDDLDKY